MGNIVCHFTECKEGSTIASARIVRFLEREFNCAVLDKPNAELVKDYDVAFCVSSASGFADPGLREQVGEVCARAKKYVFVQNEYMTTQAGQINKWFDRVGKPRHRTVWSSILTAVKNPHDRHIDWNRLTWDPQPFKDPEIDGLFYYGAPRSDREIYFQKWLGADKPYRKTLSCTSRAVKKFQAMGLETDFTGPMTSFKDIARYQSSLYVEDQHTHKHYNCPANRFYECVSAGVPLFFDPSVCNTFKQAGIPIDLFVVENSAELMRLLGGWCEVREQQRELFQAPYLQMLTDDVTRLYGEL